MLKFSNWDVAVDGDFRKSGDVDEAQEELSFLFNIPLTLKMSQLEVGSNGWKSIAHRAVSGAPPAAYENPKDPLPPMPGRTHNHVKSPR